MQTPRRPETGRPDRYGGNVILHHRHIQPVLIRDWSPRMDGITATIWASKTTSHHPRNWTPARPIHSPGAENADITRTTTAEAVQVNPS